MASLDLDGNDDIVLFDRVVSIHEIIDGLEAEDLIDEEDLEGFRVTKILSYNNNILRLQIRISEDYPTSILTIDFNDGEMSIDRR
jgi:hypothetical protein